MSGLDSIAVADDDAIAEQRIRRCSAVWGWGIGLGIIVGWEIFTTLKIIDPYFFSSPMTIVSTSYVAATQGTLYLDIGYTSAATIVGFLIGVTSGALIGLSTWWSQIYGRVSEPYLVTFNAIPKLALAPILIIIFGIGFESKVALAVALTIVPAAMAACGGVKSVDKDLETLLFSLGAPAFPGLCEGRRAVGHAVDREQPSGQYWACAGWGDRGRVHRVALRRRSHDPLCGSDYGHQPRLGRCRRFVNSGIGHVRGSDDCRALLAQRDASRLSTEYALTGIRA